MKRRPIRLYPNFAWLREEGTFGLFNPKSKKWAMFMLGKRLSVPVVFSQRSVAAKFAEDIARRFMGRPWRITRIKDLDSVVQRYGNSFVLCSENDGERKYGFVSKTRATQAAAVA